jgi:hypothetical protein
MSSLEKLRISSGCDDVCNQRAARFTIEKQKRFREKFPPPDLGNVVEVPAKPAIYPDRPCL